MKASARWFLCAAIAAALGACEEEGPAEQAGEEIDKAAEEIEESFDEDGPAEEVGEEIDEAVEDVEREARELDAEEDPAPEEPSAPQNGSQR